MKQIKIHVECRRSFELLISFDLIRNTFLAEFIRSNFTTFLSNIITRVTEQGLNKIARRVAWGGGQGYVATPFRGTGVRPPGF